MGEDISPNRVWRLARLAGIRAQIGYKFRVTDITCIRTHEGVLYLAVVIDLFSRRVIGWSMQGRTYADLPLQALLMAVWRRKPKTMFILTKASQFTGYEWQEFLEQHNLVPGMSRRGTCWDNAVVESLFNLLKRERIRRKKYKTREEARQDVSDYIEFFNNPQRRHVRNALLSPITFEQQQKMKLKGGQVNRGYSGRHFFCSLTPMDASAKFGLRSQKSSCSTRCTRCQDWSPKAKQACRAKVHQQNPD